MNGRTIARAAATLSALGIGAVLSFGGAAAEPAATVDSALTGLVDKAGEDAAAQAGVGALHDYAGLVDLPQLRHIAASFVPFAYAAPTFGCGSNGPITTIIAAGTTDGPNRHQGVSPEPGALRFSATPSHTGVPLNSGLVVAWVNINNGRSGIDTLDDRTEVGLPTLSRTVDTGPGTVLASMWGVINYPFANCVMTPTVGTFVVPDLPAPPATPAPEAPPVAPGANGSSGPAQTGDAPAPPVAPGANGSSGPELPGGVPA